MSIAIKVHAFALAFGGVTSAGVGYALANKMDKVIIKAPEVVKSQATHKDDPTCLKNVPHCVTYDGKIKIRFM